MSSALSSLECSKWPAHTLSCSLKFRSNEIPTLKLHYCSNYTKSSCRRALSTFRLSDASPVDWTAWGIACLKHSRKTSQDSWQIADNKKDCSNKAKYVSETNCENL